MSEVQDVQTLLAPYLVGGYLSILLFGVFLAQVYAYWFTYESDSRYLRGLVLIVLINQCANVVFSLHSYHTYFIAYIGDIEKTFYIVWSPLAISVTEIIMILVTQAFSIHRIWQLSGGSRAVTSVPVVLWLVTASLAISSNVLAIHASTWEGLLASRVSQTLLVSCLAFNVAQDLVITFLLTYYLHMYRAAFRRTKHALQKLKFYTINTGAVSSACAAVTLFTFHYCKHSLVYTAALSVTSKVYASAMLAILNMRKSIRDDMSGGDGVVSIPLAFQRSEPRRVVDAEAPVDLRVHIRKETTVNGPSPASTTINLPGRSTQKDSMFE